MISTLELHNLNELLGRELGRRENEPIFAWKHSDTMFWPATATGRTVMTSRTFDVPVIGGGVESCTEQLAVPEYKPSRIVRNSAWYVTKLLTAEELIFGFYGKHGDKWPDGMAPGDEKLKELWGERFPGEPFPVKGWRIPTDAFLPRAPGDLEEPNLRDTNYFIACIHEQTRLSLDLRLDDMLASEDRIEAEKRRNIEAAVRDSFPAFLNPKIGKRGGFVSFPWSRKAN